MAQAVAVPRGKVYDYNLMQVILASSAGTIIEWYDFYIYGSLAVFFATLFFPKGNPTIALLESLAVFGTGFAVRPLGALVFGRVGDLIGRKYAFVFTLSLMGVATTLTGLLPTYAQVGFLAPFLLVVLRLLQGLALGGEYGGAATYIAEHSPDGKRGYYTSFIQTTATVGFFVALIVVLISRLSLGDAAFRVWGWRIPFLLSAVLLALALYIRLRLQESPLFTMLKAEGKSSKAPLRDSLGSGKIWRMILLALFGATAGQAVVWYTGQFYAQIFLLSIMKVNFVTATIVVAAALAIGTPFFIFFGSLSDRIGRKKIIMSGCLIAALTYIPIYRAMLANKGNPVVLVLLVALQVLYVTMVYGPIAAFLVEYFRASIRYTSMSLPYHLGNGWFGGFTPLIASAIVAKTGNPTSGLYFPIAVALMTFVIGSLFLPETKDTKIWDEVGGEPAAVQAAMGAD